MALAPQEWNTAAWALQKGLYANVFDDMEALDTAVALFVSKLALNNLEALTALKHTLWEGTENWDTLLYERAAISGKLVLSDFTKNALRQIKK